MAKKTARLDLSKVDRKKLQDIIAKRSQVMLVSPSEIVPNPYNKNKMGAQYFAALKANLANPHIGFTQPVLVRPNPDNKDQWMIVDGEHRWKAAKEIGYETIPCINMEDMPESLAKYLMLEQNAVRGSTSDEDQKKILNEIENDPEWKKLMDDFDPYAGTVTDEPLDDASKYAVDEEDLDSITGNSHPQTLFFSDTQIALYRRVIGQIRLARGVTAEAAVIECIDFFEESTGLGVKTGDADLDRQAFGMED